MSQRRISFTFFMLAAAACGGRPEGPDLADDQQPIVGGTVTSARPEVGRISQGCTATLITRREFVTAAHCVNYLPQSRGGVFVMDGQPGINIDRIFSQGAAPGIDDIAVGRLTALAPASITPSSISTTEPAHEWLTIMGYGCTSRATGTGGGVKRFAEYFYDGQNTSYGCPGDSGGPVFHGTLFSGGSIVRINSGYYPDTGADTGADAVIHRHHVSGLVTAFEADGVSYRAHVQDYAWMPAVTNGAVAGTTGQSLRLEALQVWSARAGVIPCYSAHVAGIGWQTEVCDGMPAGTTGQSRSIEAVTIRLAARPAGTNGIEYNAYLQGIGWQGWRRDNQVAGTTGQSRRLEALMIRLF